MTREKTINRNSLFPTLVYSVDRVLADEDRLAIVRHIDAGAARQSNLDLFHEPPYQPLLVQIADLAKTWMQDHQWEYDQLVVTGMWFNKLAPGEYHRPHAHGNNFISGVYYPQACDADGIVFEDPRPQAHVMSPYALHLNTLNAPSWSFPTTENSLLLFPSWLKHHVPPTSTPRASVSFNLMLTGTVGRESDLQASEFS